MKNWYLMQISKGIWQKRNKGKISEKIYFLIKIIIINIIFVIITNYFNNIFIITLRSNYYN